MVINIGCLRDGKIGGTMINMITELINKMTINKTKIGISALLIMGIVCSQQNFTYATRNTSASDYANHWAMSYIEAMIEKNIVTGYSDGSFKPDNTITIAEFTTTLVKQVGHELVQVEAGQWFDTYIQTAKNHNLIKTDDFGVNVDYNRNISRAEMARMISRVMSIENANSKVFTDQEDITEAFKADIEAVSSIGVIGGYPDGSFRPNNQATRAEACVMLDKMMKYEPPVDLVPEETVTENDSPYPEEIFKTFPKMDLWSDEEFEEFLLGDVPETFIARGKVTDISLKRLIHEKPYCYFDPDERVFYFRTITDFYNTVIEGVELRRANYKYIKYDDDTNQKIYDTVKILLQHTKEHGKFMSVRENSKDLVKIMVGYDEHISHDFYDFFIGIDARKEAEVFEKLFTDSTDFSKYNYQMQFGLWGLIDNDYYPKGLTTQEERVVVVEANFMEDFYQEAIYQLTTHFYGESSNMIYERLMSEYYENFTSDKELNSDNFEEQEVNQFKMFFVDYKIGQKTYLIYEQK